MIVRVWVTVFLAAGFLAAVHPALAEDAEQALDTTIERAIRAGGPFFTPAEQAVINRACGYAPGEWDGYELNMHRDVLRCTDGRRVDDPAVRRVVRNAGPRIGRRVEAAMARPEVTAAINRVAAEATAAALREIGSD
ncbi:hypothetical protein RCO27_18115 [Sphingosinicella sp. LHD-64]|uniref:hypothetical protein n=1 Tax=Sphingosinicella sp. LHD-64 TaxID=3072139 RepID=UPI00280DAAF6|nr:hypothetical protein [Sphingosinicella sp. LHD-64]MDQ8758146.1 hypothetical protein [Sphingosinicella sp. LHD-64]